MYSIQTNVNSLVAQDNLRINQNFQSKTIQQLTSGYRINSSGDDAAGLSIANQFRSDSTELMQGVRNANDGVSQLQIVDGGLSNISTMLDRMKTLATQSASSTFTGNRATLDNEYQQLVSEITRQASDVGLNTGGSLNKNLSVYIGGARTSTQVGSGTVGIDLSKGSVDATALALNGTSVQGGSTGNVFAAVGAAGRLDLPTTPFLAGSTSQALTVNYTDATGAVQSRTITVTGVAAGLSGAQVISQLNTGLAGTGITAGIDGSTNNTGALSLSSGGAFTATAGADAGANGFAVANANVINAGQYNLQQAATAITAATVEVFTVSDGTNKADITLNTGNSGTLGAMALAINTALSGANKPKVTVLVEGGNLSFQSGSAFTLVESSDTAGTGSLFAGTGSTASTAALASATAGTNAQTAISAINAAVVALGTVQGVVGAGENKLNYAINLAQSQISNFDAAESQIRDADVAQQAANLTKAQVLQQASIAAMSQANSAPQAVLALLRG